MKQDQLYIGLISGTSMDGIDAALLECSDSYRVLATHFLAYPGNIQRSLVDLIQAHDRCTLDNLGTLDAQLGKLFAQAAVELLAKTSCTKEQIAAIGSHGQTVRHHPVTGNKGDAAYTLQIGDPNIIAETTGITTVADFRRRDMAAAGQGAPLVPAFHAAVFGKPGSELAVINIGGIANISVLAADGSVCGFDTGPGNCLMDQWAQRQFGQVCDRDSHIASSGHIDESLLRRLLDDPYFQLPSPKSTGPEYFNFDWLQPRLDKSTIKPEDVMRTLNQLTAASIAEAVTRLSPSPEHVYLCGGGVHNPVLMHALIAELPDTQLDTTDVLAINPDFVEAAAFAWFARQTILGLAVDLTRVTGAAQPRVLGGIYHG